jgi:hypothetical protein
MSRPQIRIYTGEGQFIDREMNDEEYDQYEIDQAETKARKQAESEVAKKRADALSKLTELGLTTDDLKALGL